MSLLDDAIEGHGGRRRWRKTKEIRAHVRSGGLLPRMKRKSRQFADYRLSVETARQRAVLEPFPEDGQRGVFDSGTVRIESADGELVEQREDARDEFFGASGISRRLRWDSLDALYFNGYAMWNYLAMPFLFEWPDFETSEGESMEEDGETWRRLDVSFPDSVHTHCPEQTFYFDAGGLMRRHDYTPDVVATHAHGVHLSSDHRDFAGLTIATSRKVVPAGPLGHPLPGPTVVWIELDEVALG